MLQHVRIVTMFYNYLGSTIKSRPDHDVGINEMDILCSNVASNVKTKAPMKSKDSK